MKIASVLAVAAVGAAAASHREKRLFGDGRPVTSDEVKGYMVSIRDITRDTHVCSGTLVKSNFVLTSANCVSTFVPNNLMVWIGPNNILNPQSYDYLFVKNKICHPQAADGQVAYDICLLELSGDTWRTPVVLDVNVQGVGGALPDSASVVGWNSGQANANGAAQGDLMRLFVDIGAEAFLCYSLYGTVGYMQSTNICVLGSTDGGGPDWCSKIDWGGPLLDNNVQIGLASYGSSGACSTNDGRRRQTTQPSVYTRLAPNSEFITSVLLGTYGLLGGLPDSTAVTPVTSDSTAEPDGDDDGGSSGAVIGAIAGIILGLVLLLGFMAFCCRRRQQKKRAMKYSRRLYQDAQLFQKMKRRHVTIDNGQIVNLSSAKSVVDIVAASKGGGDAAAATLTDQREEHDGLLFASARGFIDREDNVVPHIPDGNYWLYEPPHTEGLAAAQIANNEVIDRDPNRGLPMLTAHNLSLLDKPKPIVALQLVPDGSRGPATAATPTPYSPAPLPDASRGRGSAAVPPPYPPSVPLDANHSNQAAAGDMQRFSSLQSIHGTLPYPPADDGIPAFMVPPPTYSDPFAHQPQQQLVPPMAPAYNASNSNLLAPDMGRNGKSATNLNMKSAVNLNAQIEGMSAIDLNNPGFGGKHPLDTRTKRQILRHKRMEDSMMRAAFRFGDEPRSAFKVQPPPKEEPGFVNKMFDKTEAAMTACFAKMSSSKKKPDDSSDEEDEQVPEERPPGQAAAEKKTKMKRGDSKPSGDGAGDEGPGDNVIEFEPTAGDPPQAKPARQNAPTGTDGAAAKSKDLKKVSSKPSNATDGHGKRTSAPKEGERRRHSSSKNDPNKNDPRKGRVKHNEKGTRHERSGDRERRHHHRKREKPSGATNGSNTKPAETAAQPATAQGSTGPSNLFDV